MKTRLITKTIGFSGTEYENKSIDEIIVGIARVSSSRETNEIFNEPEKLLRHCLLNGHWSIFQQAFLGFEIITSRAIGREFLRHKSSNFQEFSQRYAEVTEFEEVELRYQSTKNRQSSTIRVEESILQKCLDNHLDNTEKFYRELLNQGVARETARFVLPECTQTKIVMSGSVREWITTLNVRLHKTAQKEARLIAESVRDVLTVECPIISKALFNFEYAYDMHILDRIVLEKYKVFDINLLGK